MLSEAIEQRLKDRFTSPLPEFHQRRIVFWIDEDEEFRDDFADYELTNVKKIILTGSNNFQVKKQLVIDDLESDYLIYDPLTYEKDHQDDWLYDIKKYSGEPFRADLVSLQMEELNIAQTSEMRRVLKKYSKFFANKERKLKIQRLGRRYEEAEQLHVDIMATLCGLTDAKFEDVIKAVLISGLEEENEKTVSIAKFGNINEFWHLVQKYTGFADGISRTVFDLAAHILVTAFAQNNRVDSFKELSSYCAINYSNYCYQFIRAWQASDLNNYLESIVYEVENRLNLFSLFSRQSELRVSNIFPIINVILLKRQFDLVNNQVIKVDDIKVLVEQLRISSWYKLHKNYFEGLFYIGKMQEFYLKHLDAFHTVGAYKIWKSYTEDFYLMDSYYRQFHIYFNKAKSTHHPFLEEDLRATVDVVEGLYHEWYLKKVNRNWLDSAKNDFKEKGFVSGVERQNNFYSHYISSTKGRTIVIISDALRYEVAAELSDYLVKKTKGTTVLESMQSTFPSITKFGMTALLPAGEITVDDKMNVYLDGISASGTVNRNKILNRANTKSIAIQYSELIAKNREQRRKVYSGKEVIYIYHNRIDATGDKLTTETDIFDACEKTIEELTWLAKIITDDLHSSNILFTADHGFMYSYKSLEESQKSGSQSLSGTVLKLGRRYAITTEATYSEYLLPIKSDVKLNGNPIQGFAPQETIRLKIKGGGENFVHGGVSLQEMVVPVIKYKGHRTTSKGFVEIQTPELILISESRKSTNFTFSLDFLQKNPVGDKIRPAIYSLYFENQNGDKISDVQQVIANKESLSDSERLFRLQFNLKQQKYLMSEEYRLVIEESSDVFEKIGFRFDIGYFEG
ncbi:putative cytoplasmic protein [Lactococcus lactis subsp. lactis]|uniref:BREX-1 system phosphatase PglZ type A n=1 Tax=Lactococcus lactis TaxID=1358 RepID=UPI00071D2B02|nr:BREX-1 system phosphatase PglZ type A [Lactococcus lactis]KST91104.1 putative cytoplasmic protein [Lactococcus lactis subsp. lactis]